MSAALITAMRAVADARAENFAASDALKLKRAAFATENAALLDHEKTTKLAVESAEANARALVLVHYEATKETAPVAGATVKLFKTMAYDAAAAFAWAKEKGLALIPEQLDATAFAKIAAVTPIPFVTHGSEARVTLGTKLNATDYAASTDTIEVSA